LLLESISIEQTCVPAEAGGEARPQMQLEAKERAERERAYARDNIDNKAEDWQAKEEVAGGGQPSPFAAKRSVMGFFPIHNPTPKVLRQLSRSTVDYLDLQMINELEPFAFERNPSTENLARYFSEPTLLG
jgi:hypothetical protein